MDGAVLRRLQGAHLLNGGAHLERLLHRGGAAVLRIAGVKLQDVLRTDCQMETAETTVTPVMEK